MEENINGRCLTFIMSSMRTHGFLLASLLFLFLFLNANMAIAASCPCCGRTYGNPRPGDEARVNQLRREHEASCCRKVSKPNNQKEPAINYGGDVRGGQEELGVQQEADGLEAERLERERRIKDAETKQKEFEQNKQDALDLLNSTKGTPVRKPGLKELNENKISSVNSDKELESKTKKLQKGWQKALSCAMEEIYDRAESLGPAGVRFSQELRNEMTRVFDEAGKPVKDKNGVNIVSLNLDRVDLKLDRRLPIGKGCLERQFIVNVVVQSKGNGDVNLDIESYFSGSAGKNDKQENIPTLILFNQNGEILNSQNSAAVNACLER
jgi:hypothetical protein